MFDAISNEMKEANISFELIIVDDGSADNSFNIALQLEEKNENVRAYQLSKNFTSHYSIFAGLSQVNGDCAIPIPDDFQIPIKSITEMYRLWEDGEKIIIPCREKRDDPLSTRVFSNLYYKFMNNFSEITFPKGGADIFLIDREIINIINNHISPKNTSSIVEVLRLGFNPAYVFFTRPSGINKKSRWSFRKKNRLALDTFISSSSFPIKMITSIGIISFMMSVILIIFYTYSKLTGIITVPGWTLLVIFISLFNGIVLLSIGIMSEYIWRIYDEVKNRPSYIIKNKK